MGYEAFKDSKLVCRNGNYLMAFGLDTKSPDWSAYHITPKNASSEKGTGKRPSWKQDPDIPKENQVNTKSPCWGEDWNRGHLDPAYIMSYDKNEDTHTGSFYDTFYITNTAMQAGKFNQQPWAHLEQKVAPW